MIGENSQKVLRIRILDEMYDKEAPEEDAMEADDVTMLKQLEKNLLKLQLSGIAGISKVLCALCFFAFVLYFALWSNVFVPPASFYCGLT